MFMFRGTAKPATPAANRARNKYHKGSTKSSGHSPTKRRERNDVAWLPSDRCHINDGRVPDVRARANIYRPCGANAFEEKAKATAERGENFERFMCAPIKCPQWPPLIL